MKIEFNINIDTNEDKDIGLELLSLISEMKVRLEQLNEEEDEE
jgi:hypothetical protein